MMMNSKSPSAGTAVTILLFFVRVTSYIRPVLSQQQPLLPCPPPGLEHVMETQDDCNCFYAFAASDKEDYDRIYAEDSVLYVPEAGKFIGPVGIREYVNFILGGPFVKYQTIYSEPAFKYAKATGPGQCETFFVMKLGWTANPYYTVNNQLGCATLATGIKYKYELTGNPDAMISIKSQKMYFANKLFAEFLPLFFSTPLTAEYVCDKIVNSCKTYSIDSTAKSTKSSKGPKNSKGLKLLQKSSKGPKNSKGLKNELDMETCVQMYNDLPDVTYSTDGMAYINGDSQGCRVLHSFMASTNDVHCPHISFEREVDINGKYKCSESAFKLPSEYFSSEELGFISYVGQNVYGFPADSTDGIITNEECPLGI